MKTAAKQTAGRTAKRQSAVMDGDNAIWPFGVPTITPRRLHIGAPKGMRERRANNYAGRRDNKALGTKETTTDIATYAAQLVRELAPQLAAAIAKASARATASGPANAPQLAPAKAPAKERNGNSVRKAAQGAQAIKGAKAAPVAAPAAHAAPERARTAKDAIARANELNQQKDRKADLPKLCAQFDKQLKAANGQFLIDFGTHSDAFRAIAINCLNKGMPARATHNFAAKKAYGDRAVLI